MFQGLAAVRGEILIGAVGRFKFPVGGDRLIDRLLGSRAGCFGRDGQSEQGTLTQLRPLRGIAAYTFEVLLGLTDVVVSAVANTAIPLAPLGNPVGSLSSPQRHPQPRLGQQQPGPGPDLRVGVFVLVEELGVDLDPQVAHPRQHFSVLQAADHLLVDCGGDPNPGPPGHLARLGRGALVEAPAGAAHEQPGGDPGPDQSLLVLRVIAAEEFLEEPDDRSEHRPQFGGRRGPRRRARPGILGLCNRQVGFSRGRFGHV